MSDSIKVIFGGTPSLIPKTLNITPAYNEFLVKSTHIMTQWEKDIVTHRIQNKRLGICNYDSSSTRYNLEEHGMNPNNWPNGRTIIRQILPDVCVQLASEPGHIVKNVFIWEEYEYTGPSAFAGFCDIFNTEYNHRFRGYRLVVRLS